VFKMTYSSTFYKKLGPFSIIYIALKIGHLPRSGIGKHIISTSLLWHYKHMINMASLESWCHDRGRDPSTFYKVSRYFAYELQYITA
jgi:hypothetical protein